MPAENIFAHTNASLGVGVTSIFCNDPISLSQIIDNP